MTRLIAVFGASPGIGKSTLTGRLAEEARRVGRVDCFDEEHILSRREFAAVATQFRANAVGTAEEIGGPDELARADALQLQSWAGEVRDRYVRIRAVEISGRRIRPNA